MIKYEMWYSCPHRRSRINIRKILMNHHQARHLYTCSSVWVSHCQFDEWDGYAFIGFRTSSVSTRPFHVLATNISTRFHPTFQNDRYINCSWLQWKQIIALKLPSHPAGLHHKGLHSFRSFLNMYWSNSVMGCFFRGGGSISQKNGKQCSPFI